MTPVSIEVVKFRDMPEKSWYSSHRHDLWYYHSPRTKPSNPDVTTLQKTLDAPLSELAQALNLAGFVTLPSCSGHYHPSEYYEKTYDSLLLDADEIRSKGLLLGDVERGENYLFKDAQWKLPWDRATFVGLAGGTGGKPEGYLAFEADRPESSYFRGLLRTIDVPGFRYDIIKRKDGKDVIELRVYTGDAESQDQSWQTLSRSLIRQFF